MASPVILRHIRNVLSPRGKSPSDKSLISLATTSLPKRRHYTFENRLFVPNENENSVLGLENLNRTSSQLLNSNSVVKRGLNVSLTPTKRNPYYNGPLPSVDTPERKRWLDEGLESFSSWQILGKGGFGTVVKGIYKGKDLAVKIIPKTNKHCSRSLKKEENAIKLRNDNIIKVFQVINLDTKYGLVLMEQWCQTNLHHLINGGALINSQQKFRILWNIGNALQHCHLNGILHLDVKPKNILVRLFDVACKLCDFGSSLNTQIKDDPCFTTFRGTIQYMSPELLQGKEATDRCDVYSMGITMWHLLYEEMPYQNENVHTIAFKVVSQNYRPKTLKGTQNNNIIALYESCWQTIPKDRPCMSQFVQKIKKFTQAYT